VSALILTVCELPDDPDRLDARWDELAEAVRRDGSDLVLLPELPFAPWLCTAPEFSADAWRAAVAADERWRARLSDLGTAAVITTRPVDTGHDRFNEAYLWTAADGERALRAKVHLPHEDGFWERSWFTPARPEWDTVRVGPVDVGMLICSEMWHFDLARGYHLDGAGLLLVPRASSASWSERWLAGGRSVALVSGAWCASANRRGGGPGFGGDCWIVDPEGQVVARTSADRPIVSAAVDAGLVDLAGDRYPRTVFTPALSHP